MRKLGLLLMILVLLFSVFGCSNAPEAVGDEEPEVVEESSGYKIGIVTGTVSQGEEDFQSALQMIDKYGSDVIVHVTYPDKFMDEMETTIANIVSLAADPEMKAIIVGQAIPGTAAAFNKVREMRDDIVLIGAICHEDPPIIAGAADIAVISDEVLRAVKIVEVSHQMGAETFVHYSFPRHMAYDFVARAFEEFQRRSEELGIEFVHVQAPDPTGDAGVTGTQQFMLEDIPRQIEKYGVNTSFWGTNCSMMEPMLKTVLSKGAIQADMCCPSPFHGYPQACGISIPPDKAGDVDYILEQIEAKVVEAGNAGRIASWKVPSNMAQIIAATEYGILYAKGEVGKQDFARFEEVLSDACGGPIVIDYAPDLSNYILFIGDYIIFGE